jgi:hypothetical protein
VVQDAASWCAQDWQLYHVHVARAAEGKQVQAESSRQEEVLSSASSAVVCSLSCRQGMLSHS